MTINLFFFCLKLLNGTLCSFDNKVTGSFRIDSMTTVKTIAIVFSNSLDPDQTRQSVWLALGRKY